MLNWFIVHIQSVLKLLIEFLFSKDLFGIIPKGGRQLNVILYVQKNNKIWFIVTPLAIFSILGTITMS